MHIPKIVRVPCYMAIAFTLMILTTVVLRPYIGWLSGIFAVVMLPLFHLFGGMPIDALDQWLRRTTRDPIWLMTQEGREWLDSEQGRKWQERQGKR
jgi:hypothetical protein